MTISATTQGLRPGVTTSSNRPVTPFEGQMIYETDTDVLAIWNGSAWRQLAAAAVTSGSVLQTVSITDTTSRGIAADYPQLSSLNATITPKSATSKILVVVSLAVMLVSGSNANRIGLFGISYGSGSTTTICKERFGATLNAANDMFGTITMSILHSPATTSACVYNILYGRYNGTYDNTVTINGDVATGYANSTITLQEIAG